MRKNSKQCAIWSGTNMGMINRVLVAAVLVLAVLAVALFVWNRFYITSGNDGFHAVYLQTGDFYFGKLVKFPSFGLEQVYLLRLNSDQSNPVSVQRFKEVFWGPEDFISINPSQVVWTAKLDRNSKFLDFIKQNPNLVYPESPATEQPVKN